MLHPKPPTSPNITNCQKGSEPDAPKTAPKVGIKKVRYETGKMMVNFVLVAILNTTATKQGILRVTPNSHKSKLESLVSIELAKMKTEPVVAPTRLPSTNIQNPLIQFIGT